MHSKINLDEDNNKNSYKKNSGESFFQVGVFLCATGIILLIIGMISVAIFQVHYQTNSEIVVPIVCCIGVAIILVSLGNNCMIQNGKAWLFSSTFGVFLTVISIVIFLFNYENNWYYPLISYILLLYVLGLIFLMGNTLWVFTLSFFSSLINQSNFLEEEPTDKHVDKKYEKEGIVNQKFSLLEAVDELQSHHIQSMEDMVINTKSESYPKATMEDNLNHKTYFQSDEASRRRFEAYQLMQGK